MSEPRWREFRQQADDQAMHVAKRLVRTLGFKRPPIDIAAVAAWLGLRVYARPSPGWDGATDTTVDPPVVWVNADAPVTRQRFAMAHEIGHVLMHPLGRVYRDSTFAPGTAREERDANDFAVELLAPLWMVEWIVMGKRRYTTGDLAAMFNVSPGAMGMQLEKLL